MAAAEGKTYGGIGRGEEDGSIAVSNEENRSAQHNKKTKMRRLKMIRCAPIFRCFNSEIGTSTVDRRINDLGVDLVSASTSEVYRRRPCHLIIMCNGIIGSAQNWKFAAKHFVKSYPDNVIVHRCQRNHTTQTFDGVDVMGKRLADETILQSVFKIEIKVHTKMDAKSLEQAEVFQMRLWEVSAEHVLPPPLSFLSQENADLKWQTTIFDAIWVLSIIKLYPDLRKISFIGHSLGGLIIRYTIALLYERDFFSTLSCLEGEHGSELSAKASLDEKYKGKVAGLEPMNFITSATPHLGSRGHKQVPVLCGIHPLELAARKTSWCLGRTGTHLFLTDNDNGQPPLLLRMVNDYDDLPFISALHSFKRRVLYSNVCYDTIVGWCTSSLRLPRELPKRQQLSRSERYKHIVHVEKSEPTSDEEVGILESVIDGWRNFSTEEMLEAMIRGLTKLSWERVDVKFSEKKQRLLSAHCAIQVQKPLLHSEGTDVIQHMTDNFLL